MPTATLDAQTETEMFGEIAERPEKELIADSRAGDLTAFDELIRRHHSRIYATVYHMT